mmetsp:Transcript_6886/g.13854  ORF Transcript_6886/g.13854 Transcript_6886/m.13854 type:complete len:172 (+) Transcript_6886:91-606(+)
MVQDVSFEAEKLSRFKRVLSKARGMFSFGHHAEQKRFSDKETISYKLYKKKGDREDARCFVIEADAIIVNAPTLQPLSEDTRRIRDALDTLQEDVENFRKVQRNSQSSRAEMVDQELAHRICELQSRLDQIPDGWCLDQKTEIQNAIKFLSATCAGSGCSISSGCSASSSN